MPSTRYFSGQVTLKVLDNDDHILDAAVGPYGSVEGLEDHNGTRATTIVAKR